MRNDRQQRTRIFNTPLDLGLRALFLLEGSRKKFDLQTLVFLDYFLIHSGDIAEGPISLHPSVPFQAGEILIKRNIMREGLHSMHQRQLIDVVFQDTGIYYAGNKLTKPFLSHYSPSRYTDALRERARWVHKRFGRYSEDGLKKFIDKNLSKWGTEFTSESVNIYE